MELKELARKEPVIENQHPDVRSEDERLAPLFLPDVAKVFVRAGMTFKEVL